MQHFQTHKVCHLANNFQVHVGIYDKKISLAWVSLIQSVKSSSTYHHNLMELAYFIAEYKLTLNLIETKGHETKDQDDFGYSLQLSSF